VGLTLKKYKFVIDAQKAMSYIKIFFFCWWPLTALTLFSFPNYIQLAVQHV